MFNTDKHFPAVLICMLSASCNNALQWHPAQANDGGSRLGTNRTQPSNVQAIIETVRKFKLVGVIVIGMLAAVLPMMASSSTRLQSLPR